MKNYIIYWHDKEVTYFTGFRTGQSGYKLLEGHIDSAKAKKLTKPEAETILGEVVRVYKKSAFAVKTK